MSGKYGQQNHKTNFHPSADLGSKIIPFQTDVLTKSPCRQRPDTGEECPLLHYEKDNTYCYNCGLIPGKGKRIYTAEEIKKALAKGIESINKTAVTVLKTATKECKWPGCTENVRKMFCKPHGNLYHSRMSSYMAKHKFRPSWDWLTRPKQYIKSENQNMLE